MTLLRALLLGLALTAPTLATAQWQWIDPSGRRVFSDQAPPPDTPAKNILKQPGVRAPSSPAADIGTQAAPPPASGTASTSPAAPAQAAAGSAAAATRPGGRDEALEKKRKEAEAAAAAKRKEDEERLAKQKAESCDRARQGKATLASGMRLARVNAKGEREFLDEKARDAEIKRMDEVIAADCKAPS
ncbi:DUF4124 domain-containing protein [Ramlibacter sp. AN1015]|uniref:DUF4124 domain-containing protein n=1 Tax=Ramlibacter sp. AN1015 TaxID=3133428 RepID=UPI0030C5EC77